MGQGMTKMTMANEGGLWARLCRLLLFRILRFRSELTVEPPRRCVIALAPHTSNWDFIVGMLFSGATGFRCQFVMKAEWFRWPLGGMLRRIGGIPVRRDRHNGLVSQLAEEARHAQDFHLCITPEGTRKRVAAWKSGFYYIALEADIPILLYGLDYRRRLLSCTRMLRPTGDVEGEMREIKQYFAGFTPRHVGRFTTGEE